MNVYITRINGLSLWNPSQYRQYMTAEIAHWLGFKEMGIYRYSCDGESSESLSGRLDGIIGGISAGDVIICQFPTGNGLKFEQLPVSRLKAYRGRVAVFIHDVDALVRNDRPTIDLYNQAEVVIVPSYSMRQFLLEHGMRKDIKWIVQEMWDYTVDAPFMKKTEYRQEIHYADDSAFEELKKWNYAVPLKQYGNPDESFPELSRGGFGLVWRQDKDYLNYSASPSLSRYLAAGIPVIVPAGISNQSLIEANHLGLVVNSLDEAAAAVEAVNEPEYQEYVHSVEEFAPALRAGCYTKKCLTNAVQAFYRKDAGRIMIPAVTYSLDGCRLSSVIVRESYLGVPALSWSFSGTADGFLICGTRGAVIHDTRNIHQHYLLLEDRETGEEFSVKAYVDTLKGKLVVAEEKAAYWDAKQFEKAAVSVIIPAYNAEGSIARSIDTALAQSFADVEIVVVDDGSTDHTPEIIDWYAEKYPNVTALHQENGGAGAARNAGIKHAQGEYIGFLDSDDMFYPHMVERLYCSAKQNSCDIAIAPFYFVTNDSYDISIFSQYPMKEDTAVNIDDFFDIHSIMAYQTPTIWNKLYRAALIKGRAFPEILYEDEAWLPYIMSFANQACYVDEGLCEYDRTVSADTLNIRSNKNSSDTKLKNHKKSILFYLENGNQMKLEKLKNLAQKELRYFARVLNNTEYEKLWEEIDKTF